MRKQTNTLSPSPKGFQSPKFSDSDFREVRGLGLGRPKSSGNMLFTCDSKKCAMLNYPGKALGSSLNMLFQTGPKVPCQEKIESPACSCFCGCWYGSSGQICNYLRELRATGPTYSLIHLFHMLEVGPGFLAGGQIIGLTRRARGKAMATLGALVALVALVGSANAAVEFKHHNNTEMAAVLQQVHNRLVKHF
jgi:hypothetical protein